MLGFYCLGQTVKKESMGKFEIAAIVGGIAILFFYSQFEPLAPGVESVPSSQPAPSPNIDSASTTVGEIYGQQVKQIFDAVSLRAIDGDSLEAVMADGTSREIRLASIDAPERNQTFGRDAQAHLAAMVKGQSARIFQTDTDRYDRAVSFVLTGVTATDVNSTMLSDGFAWHAIKYSDDPSLAELERQAKAARRGLWSQPSPVAPWVYRK
jgi:endonuclease YncB( thermonuclease family)